MEPLNWANPDDRKKIKDHLAATAGAAGPPAPAGPPADLPPVPASRVLTPPGASGPAAPSSATAAQIPAAQGPDNVFPGFPAIDKATGIPAAPTPGAVTQAPAPTLPAPTWSGGAPDQGTQDAQKIANWKLQAAMQFANTNNGAATLFTDPAEQFVHDQAKTAGRNQIVRDMMATTAGQGADEQFGLGLKQKQWETQQGNTGAMDRLKTELSGKAAMNDADNATKLKLAQTKDPNGAVHADAILKLVAAAAADPRLKLQNLIDQYERFTGSAAGHAPGLTPRGKPAALPPTAGAPAGPPATATAAAGPDALSHGQLAENAMTQLRSSFGKQTAGVGGSSAFQVDPGKLTPEALTEQLPIVAQAMSKLTPEAKAMMAADLKSGQGLGDVAALRTAIGRHYATNRLIDSGPALDNQGKVAGLQKIVDDQGKPLMDLTSTPQSYMQRLWGELSSTASPSRFPLPDTAVLPTGERIPIPRSGVYSMGSNFENSDARRQAAARQAQATSPILRALLEGQ